MEQTGFLNQDFQTCLNALIQHGLKAQPRGVETRELLNYNITLQSARNRVITFKERNVNTKYLLGEFIWYLTGSNDPEGILPYSKFWDNIRNTGQTEDGRDIEQDYPAGSVNSNYGNRLFGLSPLPAFNFIPTQSNQWKSTIDLLIKDKDSRQAIMNIHVPSDRHPGNKDVACTLTLQFFIRENALHMICNMRSNDIILGFTNDVFQFTMLQECMQLLLKEHYPDLQLGHYFHNAGSMHVYDRHFEMTNKIIAEPVAFDLEMIPMDKFDNNILHALVQIEFDWRGSGMSEDFNFEGVTEWMDLTPYWQTLIKAMFAKDEAAMHALFAVPDDDEPEIEMIE